MAVKTNEELANELVSNTGRTLNSYTLSKYLGDNGWTNYYVTDPTTGEQRLSGKGFKDTEGYFGEANKLYSEAEIKALMRSLNSAEAVASNQMLQNKAASDSEVLANAGINTSKLADNTENIWRTNYGTDAKVVSTPNELHQTGSNLYNQYLTNKASNVEQDKDIIDQEQEKNPTVTYLDSNDIWNQDGSTNNGMYLRNSSGQLAYRDNNGNYVLVDESNPEYIAAKNAKIESNKTAQITNTNNLDDRAFATALALAGEQGFTYNNDGYFYKDKIPYIYNNGEFVKYNSTNTDKSTTLTHEQLSEQMKNNGFVLMDNGLWFKNGKIYSAYLSGKEPTKSISITDYYKSQGYTVNKDGTLTKDNIIYSIDNTNGNLIEKTTSNNKYPGYTQGEDGLYYDAAGNAYRIGDDGLLHKLTIETAGVIPDAEILSATSDNVFKYIQDEVNNIKNIDINTLYDNIAEKFNTGLDEAKTYLNEYVQQLIGQASDYNAQTLSNYLSALRSNRASALTSNTSRGAQNAADTQTMLGLNADNNDIISALLKSAQEQGYNLASTAKDIPANAINSANTLYSNMTTPLASILANLGYQFGSSLAGKEASNYAANKEAQAETDALNYQKNKDKTEADEKARLEDLLNDPESLSNANLSDKISVLTYLGYNVADLTISEIEDKITEFINYSKDKNEIKNITNNGQTIISTNPKINIS